MFVLCEFLNMLFLVVNFHMTNVFLNNKWGTYGFEVYNYYMEDPRLRLHNPMCNVFPTKVSCTINTVSPGGAIQSVNGLCLLAQNIVNEKVFLILYFWYVFLFIVMGFYAIARIITILVPQVSKIFLPAQFNYNVFVYVNVPDGSMTFAHTTFAQCDICPGDICP
jgi:hypothetical protein